MFGFWLTTWLFRKQVSNLSFHVVWDRSPVRLRAAVHVSLQGYNPLLVCALDVLRTDRKELHEQHLANLLRKKKGIVNRKRKENHAERKAYKSLVQKNIVLMGEWQRQQLISLSCIKKLQFHTLTPYITEKKYINLCINQTKVKHKWFPPLPPAICALEK